MIPPFPPVGFQVLTALLGCTLVAQWQNTFFPSPKIKGLKPSTSTEREIMVKKVLVVLPTAKIKN